MRISILLVMLFLLAGTSAAVARTHFHLRSKLKVSTSRPVYYEPYGPVYVEPAHPIRTALNASETARLFDQIEDD